MSAAGIAQTRVMPVSGTGGIANALKSPLFMTLRDKGLLDNDHVGGCVLYEQRDKVEQIVDGKAT